MSILGVIMIIVGLYLAFKLVGLFLKVAMWVVVAVGIYLVASPLLM